MAAPLTSVKIGMGDDILILASSSSSSRHRLDQGRFIAAWSWARSTLSAAPPAGFPEDPS